MRCSRGQAAVDYVALIGVVAVLLALGTGLATGRAPGIVNAVAGQFRHALCVVGGGPCPDLSPQPCAVASRRDARHYAISLVIVRGDHDRYVLREQLSDGTVRLTVARSGALGAEFATGGRVKVSVRGRTVGMTDEVRAGIQGVIASGKVFLARDAREAAGFMRAIGDGDDPPAAAREVFYEGGVRGLATIGIGNSVAGATLRGFSETMIGGRRDRRTGGVTLSARAGSAGWGLLTVALGGPVATHERNVSLAVKLDRHRRATELSLSATGALAGGAAWPPGLSRALGGRVSAMSADARGRRFEVAARLDLRDPLVAAAWEDFRDHPGSGRAIRVLGETIAERAHFDVRTYRTKSTSSGVSAGIGQVVQLGGEYEHLIEDSRLVAASSRPSGGLWERRFDCVVAA
jgi:hypothetical protein